MKSTHSIPLFASTLLLVLCSSCTAPIGADRVTTRQAYAQVNNNALETGQPSASTVSLLHRHGMKELAERQPDEAVKQLHEKAVVTGERDLLFALAEMSYVSAEKIRRSVKPWDPREARDYYLGSAVYAWLFLFSEENGPLPSPFDRRFREACDFYNYGLGLGLTDAKGTNDTVRLESSRRPLPVGGIEVRLNERELTSQFLKLDRVLLAGQFQVRGLSVRNREPGLGAPLIGVMPKDPSWKMSRAAPATALLRVNASLADLTTGAAAASLDLYSSFETPPVMVGQTEVPLEVDLTTFRAYTLSQTMAWKLGKLNFLAPAELFPSQLILNQPFAPDRIPVVLVHGTFSSPVTWAEMANVLTADPELRKRYQVWTFIYGSGNPLIQSVADLRATLSAEIRKHDPAGTNKFLNDMVVIGHSQGGLLVKGTAVDSGDKMWNMFSKTPFDELDVTGEQRSKLRSLFFLEPLPFVKRVVFIATPHRGSYLSSGFVRVLGQKLISLPGALIASRTNLLSLASGSEIGGFLHGRMPNSLDGMSPKNPGLLAIAEIPVSSNVVAHSIVAIDGDDEPPKGGDGVVKYSSAHVDYVESEFVVRSFHTCLDNPATIEEVRRILHEHLEQFDEQQRHE